MRILLSKNSRSSGVFVEAFGLMTFGSLVYYYFHLVPVGGLVMSALQFGSLHFRKVNNSSQSCSFKIRHGNPLIKDSLLENTMNSRIESSRPYIVKLIFISSGSPSTTSLNTVGSTGKWVSKLADLLFFSFM